MLISFAFPLRIFFHELPDDSYDIILVIHSLFLFLDAHRTNDVLEVHF